MLYLEEIDVSDSHDFNISMHSGVHDQSPKYQQTRNGTNQMASPRQMSSPRTPRIFSPTMPGYMTPQASVPVVEEHYAPRIDAFSWNADNISVSNLWMPQEVNIRDISSVNVNSDSVNMNVDSSDDGDDIDDEIAREVIHLQAKEMMSAPK